MTAEGATPAFDEAEYRGRVAAVRAQMAARDLDLCLVSTPENIFYLSGLDHWGYFVPHVLMVPAEGEMVLVTRQMEQVTVANQVRHAAFRGYADNETAADVVVRLLGDRAQAKGRAGAAAAAVVDALGAQPQRRQIGIEKWSAGLPHGLAESLAAALPDVEWQDMSGLIDALRRIKSPREQACMREAARISDAGMAAAVDAIHDGARERDIAAECHRAIIGAGGTFPGFGPFIRSTARLGEEHTSWGDGVCRLGEVVFLELSGCYRRYHAPLGRLVFIGRASQESVAMAHVCIRAFDAAVAALAPGIRACDVYRAWQEVVDSAGLSHYRRHHCGYLVGIGFPPSWTGGNSVSGLRHDSDLEIGTGMSFHMLSWLMGTGRGDYFVSNTVLLGPDGPEVLTRTPAGPIEKL
jgi:Xaa-Pro dipeptidase